MNLSLFLTRLDKLSQVLKTPELRRALVRHRVLAGAEHRQLLPPDLAAVVDIGANWGQFSPAVREYASGARVIVFEPLPGSGAIFQRVFARDPMVRLHPVAVGAAAEEGIIHSTEADDSSSPFSVSTFPGRKNPFCM